ncbi:MAG: acyl carrier protein [Staphylococcus epidermidis]|jgi:acyl carrier protein|nr:acyl carrier protein [Veillonella sp.]MDU1612177.1 acyl carrier protein [Staphylococcus epidermidis]MDU1788522.1 acyl carrier protein [Streptococcus thermophilus]MDU3139429.1 acyl carrier protein [Staphylococcus lugdunensis]MDU3768875.1 acyl carrier protein [Cutibacterium granulosum]MDU3872484.1 acyl carrier protein [Staphylococcus warneri]MDU7037947.1 acyl carrier protein [Lactococcus lactis]
MELKQELKELVSEVIEIDDFKEDDNFVEDLGVDSMMALEIVVRIEKKYQISIPEEELPNIQSLNQVYEVVSDLINKNK